jgi:hypothetical protein
MKKTILKQVLSAALTIGATLLATQPGCVQNHSTQARPAAASRSQSAAHILAEAIRVPTVNPPGDEAPLAAYLVGLLRNAGLEARLVETPHGDSSVGRGAAWGVLRGRGARPPLVLLAHLDTVPADARHWHDDPFAGVVRDGNVIGRGAQDAKGVAVIQLLALLELAKRETPLARDIIFLATPDEESGGRDGAGWLVREHRSLLRGARFLLTEGGGIMQGPRGAATWQVGITEKSPCWLRLTAKGPPGHSSMPTGADAVPRRHRGRCVDPAVHRRQPSQTAKNVEGLCVHPSCSRPIGSATDSLGLGSVTRASAASPQTRGSCRRRPTWRLKRSVSRRHEGSSDA